MDRLSTLTARSYRVLLYDEPEEYEDVIRMLTEHLTRNPADGIAYNNRGLAYSEIGRGEEALIDFEKAIEFAPVDPTPLVNRANLYERVRPIGEFQKAIEDYSKAISIESDNPAFHRCMAHVYLKIERVEAAIESFSNAIRINPEFRQTYIERGRAYARLGQTEKAEEDFKYGNGR